MNRNKAHNGKPRPLLKDGGTIGIAAPASGVDAGALDRAMNWIKSHGYDVREAANLYRQNRYLAGPDDTRASLLSDMFADPAIDAIFTARGGYGTMRILDKLDYSAISISPKPFVGFSDTTSLQLAILKHCGLTSYSGLALVSDFSQEPLHTDTEESLWSLLAGKERRIEGMKAIRPGAAEGPLIGGCLSMMASITGTPHIPDLKGAILFMEDVGEEPYRIDRMLTQLELAGVFEEVSAVLLGTFTNCNAKDPRDGTVEDVLEEITGRCNVPVISGLPYGHHRGRVVLPIGQQALLTSQSDGTATLTIPGFVP